MIDSQKLLLALQKQVRQLEEDLRGRCDTNADVDRPLRVEYEAAKKKGRTALTYSAWLHEELTQVAVAWVVGSVFVRFLEDNELIETPCLAGAGNRLQRAKDEHEMFFRKHPTLTEREYFEKVFTEVGTLPAMKEFFDRKHNPLWRVPPSGDAAKELLDFWRKTDPDRGALIHDFTDPDWNTRFLGDLYQDLSEAARDKYALLQTPEFIEEFILDRTLTPAIQTFGYQVVRIIDPTCGSGHFLLGSFHRLFRLWQEHQPGDNPRTLAQKALDSIFGVDLNPFAVAIARFRLLLIALKVCSVGRLRDGPDFHIHLAVGDSLLHGRRFREFESHQTGPQRTFATEEIFRDGVRHHYEVEDVEALHRILGQQYHAVVGNPPYITVKDRAVGDLYRARYLSCHRKYSLSVPFMERFFDLAIRGDGTPQRTAGFVGQITSNSFMKREFGKKLVEEYLARWDLTHVLDTSGAYIPGHGTPTVILFGRNQPPVRDTIRTVLGIRGEPATPVAPAQGLVWHAISRQVDQPGSVSEWVNTADFPRANFHKHPWSIGGGGAAELKKTLDEARETTLDRKIGVMGVFGMTNADEVFVGPLCAFQRACLPAKFCRPFITGEQVRDWRIDPADAAFFPYENDSLAPLESLGVFYRWFWQFRTLLGNRATFSKLTYFQEGRPWWGWHQIALERLRPPLTITSPCVPTHNQFALDRGGSVFNRQAPIIKLPPDQSEDIAIGLLGLLNSSLACFWMKQVMHNKGGPGGGSSKDEKWHDFYELSSTQLALFPLPADKPYVLAKEIDRLGQIFQRTLPASVLANPANHTRAALVAANVLWDETFSRMVTLQEELDWWAYRAYGVISDDRLLAPTGRDTLPEVPPLSLGERPFEILLARALALQTTETKWFEWLNIRAISALPAHWPPDYTELCRRRFNAIQENKQLSLIERPECKRTWEWESWEKRFEGAAYEWLLNRLEGYFFEGDRVYDLTDDFDPAGHGFTAATRPHLITANELATVVNNDSKFLELAGLYHGSAGFSVPKMVRDLVESESVPYLPVHRYKVSGVRKRKDWEATWDLQRKEDAIEADVRKRHPKEKEERLKDLIRKAQHEQVGDVPVPPKYVANDFQKSAFWKLRGKLDVPKERWISYPGAERDGDPSPLIAWAGWDHLQQAQALAEYYLDAKNNQGWPEKKLKMLLGGLLDLLPWLKQWHNEMDPDYGMGLGDYFEGFLDEECRALGVTIDAVNEARYTSALDA
jgi:hypothetical protein